MLPRPSKSITLSAIPFTHLRRTKSAHEEGDGETKSEREEERPKEREVHEMRERCVKRKHWVNPVTHECQCVCASACVGIRVPLCVGIGVCV